MPISPSPDRFQSLAKFANLSVKISQNVRNHLAPFSPASAAIAIPSPNAGFSGYTGYFTGFVNNSSSPGTGISGVTVQAFSLAGAICPSTVCLAVTSQANGYFKIVCPTGVDYVSFEKGWWDTNYSFDICGNGTTTWIGTTYLIPDGIATGTLLGDDPVHAPIAGVTISSSTRDFTVNAQPKVVTGSTGTFRVPVPPVAASRIDFAPPGPLFVGNFTFVTAESGQTVNLGIVYLEPQVRVHAVFYDIVTGLAIAGSFAFPNSLTVCSAVLNFCDEQGPATISGVDNFGEGPPGHDYIKADATGYLENVTSIGFVPKLSPGQTFCVPHNCKVYLVPIGQVSFSVSISGSGWKSAPWPTGEWIASDCGLDGYNAAVPLINPATFTINTTTTTCFGGGCVGVPGGTVMAAFPLRNDIEISPDTTGVCDFFPTWPIPGYLPVWGNESFANVTPYATTNVGWLNLTAGDYVSGYTYIQGTTWAPGGGFEVSATSRAFPSLPVYPFNSATTPDVCGGTIKNTSFCVPSPPGPDKITVNAVGYPNNYTWVQVPTKCCSLATEPLSLAQASLSHFQSINLTSQPTVTGRVVIAGTKVPPQFSTVKVCPAASHATQACVSSAGPPTGLFSVASAPTGWDTVTVTAVGYAPNSDWVYATGKTVSAGTIPVQPEALIEGRVIAPNGTGIPDVGVHWCSVATATSTQACLQPLGTGLTTSDGRYEGFVLGGWLPWATDQVLISAAGYSSDWTWVNATVGATVLVPTLTLFPVGSSNGVARASGTRLATEPVDVWIEGRVVDNATGWGISSQQINACIVGGFLCTLFSDGSNSGGYFNQSVAAGVYNLTFTVQGYLPLTVLVPAIAGPTVDVGTVRLVSLDWVTGRTVIGPWESVYVPSGSKWKPINMGPASTVFTCLGSSLCANSLPADSSGEFTVLTYAGHYVSARVTPSFPGGFFSAPGGFNPGSIQFNTTGSNTTLPSNLPVVLDIFTLLYGTVRDNGSYDPSTGQYLNRVSWGLINGLTVGANNGQVTWTTTAAGDYWLLLPPGNGPNLTTVTVDEPTLFYYAHVKVAPTLVPGGTTAVPLLTMNPFGWGEGRVVDGVTHQPVAYVGVAASYSSPLTGVSGNTVEVSDGDGFVNLSAPTSASTLFTFGGTNDYNTTNLTTAVTPYRTTLLNGTSPIRLEPWGWVESSYLNFSTAPGYLGTVFDPVVQQPVPFVQVSVVNAFFGLSLSSPTNSLGEFLADSPISVANHLLATDTGYENNQTGPIATPPGSVRVYPTVNLTGDGIIAARVIGSPGGNLVPGATVVVCPAHQQGTQNCATTTTNSSGIFWANNIPGLASITVSAPGYATNYTAIAQICSDCWIGLPPIVLSQYATITGIVRGLPTGLPLPNATVGACSTVGVPTGPCLYEVQTLPDGSFTLQVPAGSYILSAVAPSYNFSFLPLNVVPGELVNVGSLLLQAYGVVQGTVVDAVTGVPIGNATVTGCPVLAWIGCSASVQTSSGGAFGFEGPPGGITIAVSAAGYADGYVNATLVSGATVALPPIGLFAIGSAIPYALSGTVENSAAPGGPGVAGVVVSAEVGATTAASTVTDSNGKFHLTVHAGAYTLVATEPGYTVGTLGVNVLGSMSNLVIDIGIQLFAVSGTVSDALNGLRVGSVSFYAGGSSTLLGLSDSMGAFSLGLANGTYTILAVPPSGDASTYSSVTFQVAVVGSGLTRNVELSPPSVDLVGTVVDSATGAPVPGASLSIVGSAPDGASVHGSTQATGEGAFSLAWYSGQYTLTVSANGYQTTSQSVTLVSPGSAGMMVSLTRAAGAPSTAIPIWVFPSAAAVFLVAVGAVWWLRRRPTGGKP